MSERLLLAVSAGDLVAAPSLELSTPLSYHRSHHGITVTCLEHIGVRGERRLSRVPVSAAGLEIASTLR